MCWVALYPVCGKLYFYAPLVPAFSQHPNPDYKQDVKDYLVEYRKCRIEAYETMLDRVYPIQPIIENRGHHSASNVTVEFTMPSGYVRPAGHLCFDRSELTNEELFSCMMLLEEPEPYISAFDNPNLSVLPDLSDSILFSAHKLARDQPAYEERNGVYCIEYTIDMLVQHRPKDDLKPFWLWLNDIVKSTIWRIPFKVTSADLQEPVRGHLTIVIQALEDAQNVLGE